MTTVDKSGDQKREESLADHPLTVGRFERYRQALESGGFPYRFDRSITASDLHAAHQGLKPEASTGVTETVAGRVMLRRSFGRLVFATLRDATGTIQLMANASDLGDAASQKFENVDLGDWVGATGEVVTTKRGELSIRVQDFVVLQPSLRPLPDKWHGLQDIEQRSRHRYVDLMVNDKSRAVALSRVAVIAELRRQFEKRGYIEVETPVLLPEATGALAKPFVTHHHALDMPMYLRIATELYLKRLVVGGFERVFEIGRIFRNEGIDASHNPEFTMLESYEAFADYLDILTMVEEIIASIAESVTGSTVVEYGDRRVDLTPPYRRARMTDLVAEAIGSPVDFEAPISRSREQAAQYDVEVDESWGHGKILDALFEALVADDLWQPTFVLDHPREISPLARTHRFEPHLTERFELFIAGSEYANAFSELNDPFDQRAQFEAQAAAREAGDNEAHPVDRDYLLALEYGLPPTGGLGIGVDRLVMLLTNQHHIRDVMLFPTLRPEL